MARLDHATNKSEHAERTGPTVDQVANEDGGAGGVCSREQLRRYVGFIRARTVAQRGQQTNEYFELAINIADNVQGFGLDG